MKTTPKVHSQAGFTLVEILFAMAIFMLVVAGVMPMYVQSSKTIMTADSKLDVNGNVRKVTDEMIQNARQADAFVLYDSYKGAWIDGDFVDFRNSAYVGMGRLRDGETGRFLVLLYYDDDPYPNDSKPPPLKQMVGLYLDAAESESSGPMRIFVKDTFDDDKSMEENIPAASFMGSHDAILPLMTGLMEGDVFYNFGGKSVMVNGKISHANGAIKETNTYNFTITPR